MKKRELYILNWINRAAEYGVGTYIDQLIKALKKTEWKLIIVNLNARGNEIVINEKDGYRQINIPFPTENQSYSEQYYLRIIPCLLKEIISEDSKTEYIFHINFMTYSSFIKSLKKSFHCKVIFVSHFTDWSLALSGDYSGLEKIINQPKKAIKTNLEKSILKRFKEDIKIMNSVDCFVCVAQHTLETYYNAGNICPRKSAVIYNALEDIYIQFSSKEKLLLRKKYLIEENTKIVLFAGRLDEMKGVAYLIQAFKNVLITHPNTRLFIAGEGDFNLLMKESANCWSKITFTGRLNKKQLCEFYNVADMGVICSLHEEFGLVAIEMMMHTLPVIVSQTGGLDEIVEDTVSGLKVPVLTIKGKRQVDVYCLSEKIRFLLNNPSLSKELGENGRKRFLEKFELSVFREKMLGLYEGL